MIDASRELRSLLYGDMPDSRSRTSRNEVFRAGQVWQRVFCCNCSADGGLVTKDYVEFISYLCDRCAEKHGGLPMPEINEAIVRG